ncbi:SapC family protein [Stappia sp. ES.058]|uniref:SapC family protein n=1 Tax=Stappia sp. ES.058 TaxID=1881061 RepID=UPI000879F11D|nr:SapC family protein [Stappia sp. ES.058]SDU48298.1 SapC protein [Stappia sp. ES.058]
MTKSEADGTAPRAAEAAPSGMPLFYSRPEAIRAERHANVRVDLTPNYTFSRGSHAAPLNAVEFAAAARHYPIVFAAGTTPPAAVAVLGLRTGKNLFVDEAGNWQANTYIPSYVRRYPFVLARSEDQSEFVLCMDADSDKIATDEGSLLFEDGEPAEITRKALEFCGAFQREALASETILAKLSEHDLLVPNSGRFTLASGEVLTVNDFLVVDEKRLAALSDEAFLELRHADALTAIYSHMLSMRNWGELVRLEQDG